MWTLASPCIVLFSLQVNYCVVYSAKFRSCTLEKLLELSLLLQLTLLILAKVSAEQLILHVAANAYCEAFTP